MKPNKNFDVIQFITSENHNGSHPGLVSFKSNYDSNLLSAIIFFVYFNVVWFVLSN